MPQMDDTLLEVGEIPPDFAAETLSGESVTLTKYEGLQRTLVFLSLGCTPCTQALPKIKELASKIEDKGGILALIFSQSIEDVKSFADEHQIKIPIWIAPPSSSFWQDYKIAGTPSFCVIDPQNKVVSSGFFGGREWVNFAEKKCRIRTDKSSIKRI